MSESLSVKYSTLESNRFGYKIYRGAADKIEASKIMPFLLSEEVDLLFLRIPSINLGSLASLSEAGVPYIFADTLVYYYCDILNYTPKQYKNNDLKFIVAEKEHESILDDLVKEIFIGYHNHYSSNPYLNKQSILGGYQEWLRHYIADLQSGRVSWIIIKNDRAVGFIACSFEQEICEIVLNGVHPDVSGEGIYSDAIRFTQQFFKGKWLATLKVSTQVHNYAVQKVWAREGFFLQESYNTVHLNSFLNKTVYPKKNFRVTGKELSDYLRLTFIRNLAKEVYSKWHIKLYSITHHMTVLQEINDEDHYQVVISYPYENIDESKLKLLAKVSKNNNIHILAYYDLYGEQP